MAQRSASRATVSNGQSLETSLKKHEYWNANLIRSRSYWDFKLHPIGWRGPSNYVILQQIGAGTYSEVFEGKNESTNERCVIKVLKPVKVERIQREVKILENLRGGPNIIKFIEAIEVPSSKKWALVFEYIENTDFERLHWTFTDADARYYLYEVLKALDFAHSMGIMHRDVKPNNIVVDKDARQLRLIDWGLGDFYHVGTRYPLMVSARCFRAPELLLKNPVYDYWIDMWSFGCMAAAVIFRKEPFFRGLDERHQIRCIVDILGSEGLARYVTKYKVAVDAELSSMMRSVPRRQWEHFVRQDNQHLASPEALDLVDNILRYDPTERLTARQAMAHPYFESMRKPPPMAAETRSFAISRLASISSRGENTNDTLENLR